MYVDTLIIHYHWCFLHFSNLLSQLRNSFSHNHLSVSLVSPTDARNHSLPEKISLVALSLQPYLSPPDVNPLVWCLVSIMDISIHLDNISYRICHQSYVVVV
ncbi:hypothetical protein LINGRAHAP2_LOCUS10235 [Linum grandiflorum]